ncbi:mrc1-like domain-containing protein [Ophiostoma piceae UAMH 11346]|uniref:Mrc1-like domain-containing protein n=1 Tax=Ophiostoma piceae (strain UAMH 11346) TaxID=1262450 RepID=S3DAQ3_OPHP1|nr:mrc1-like domain-containing protein [Ophiostoma piceae UAMH 11346]
MATFSRTPSPAARSGSDSDSVVATPMTPRTKMRQLFATIGGGDDDDSSASDREREGDEENRTPSRKAKTSPSGKTSAKKSPKLSSSTAFSRTNNPRSPLRAASSTQSRTPSPRLGPIGATSDEESDVEVRPRGRLAARMQANNTSSTTATTEPAEPLADNARDRVKRMLQLAAKGNKQEPEKATSQNPEDTNDAEDEDDVDVPAARSRKRLTKTNLRTSRRSTPVSSHDGSPSRQLMQEESPAMFMTPSKRTEREGSPDMFMTPSKGGDKAADDSANSAGKPGRNARFQALVARKREEARARAEAEERKRAARQAAMAEEEDEDEPMGQLDEDDDLLMADADSDNVSDITDDEGGRKLSQKVGATRPARKASKKALEEMHRETQRMSRNLQLVHEAKTRKKITKASLFERFNFKPQGAAAAPAEPAVQQEATGSSRPTSPASPHNLSETEMPEDSDTPPSSPPVPDAQDEYFSAPKPHAGAATTSVDKGKGKAIDVAQEPPQVQPKRQVRVRMPTSATTNLVMIDSDDDAELEIVQTSKSKLNMLFDSVPLKRDQEPRSMMALRRLAQVGSPGRKSRGAAAKDRNGKPELSLGELQQSLQNRARLQAKMEREQRLEALRAKGIRIQTEEEREKEMEEVDDIVSRARQEAEELMQREREEAKKLKKGKSGEDDANGEVDPLDWDDSEDEEGGGDYIPEDDEEIMQEIELSGSDDDDKDEEDEETMEGALIDEEAESAEDSEDGEAEAEDDIETAEVLPTPTRARSSKRRALIVSDDEDEDRTPTTATATPLPPKIQAKTPGPKSALSVNTPSGLNSNLDSPAVPTSVLRSATKPFIPGMPIAVGGPAGLGLTQIFAGTMDDGDSQLMGSPAPGGFASPSQLMPTLGNFAEPDFSQMAAIDKASAVMDSQPTQEWLKRMQGGGSNNTQNQESGTSASTSQMVDFDFSQSQAHGLESLLREPEMSQMSQLLGPSQDLVPQDYTPLKVRFIEHQPATMETVVLDKQTQQLDQSTQILPQSQSETALPAATSRPRGRLFRKADLVKAVVDEEEEEEDEEERAAAEATLFAKMREASTLEKRFRKKSKAKEMVEDQAEESEDEYAGLGGADGEDSDDESLASVKDLIDDQKVSSGDNAKLAAFYADRERENDEKQVEKLFRDVTTGMLRRKRGGGGGGGDYDLSDSDDGGEARRRMKRRQFARMQKALFADERVSKVAENPRNHAFMRTIEDRGSDDEMDFLFEGPPAVPASSSTPTTEAGASQAMAIPDSQPALATTAAAAEKPATTNPRRRRLSVTNGKKPSNLGEIRESLSSLLEDYQHNGRESSNLSMVADSEFGSDSEDASQASNKENNPLATASAFRRPGGRTHNAQVVDRISLKRNNSSASSVTTSSSTTETGSAASSTNFGAMGPTGFRVPALLRRATTNSLASNGSSGSSRSGSGRSVNFSMSTTRGPADKASSSNSGSGAGNAPDSGKIKKNASKMSGIHYFARENERLATLAENDKRRQAKKVRSAEGRSRAVGGLFGAGKFE